MAEGEINEMRQTLEMMKKESEKDKRLKNLEADYPNYKKQLEGLSDRRQKLVEALGAARSNYETIGDDVKNYKETRGKRNKIKESVAEREKEIVGLYEQFEEVAKDKLGVKDKKDFLDKLGKEEISELKDVGTAKEYAKEKRALEGAGAGVEKSWGDIRGTAKKIRGTKKVIRKESKSLEPPAVISNKTSAEWGGKIEEELAGLNEQIKNLQEKIEEVNEKTKEDLTKWVKGTYFDNSLIFKNLSALRFDSPIVITAVDRLGQDETSKILTDSCLAEITRYLENHKSDENYSSIEKESNKITAYLKPRVDVDVAECGLRLIDKGNLQFGKEIDNLLIRKKNAGNFLNSLRDTKGKLSKRSGDSILFYNYNAGDKEKFVLSFKFQKSSERIEKIESRRNVINTTCEDIDKNKKAEEKNPTGHRFLVLKAVDENKIKNWNDEDTKLKKEKEKLISEWQTIGRTDKETLDLLEPLTAFLGEDPSTAQNFIDNKITLGEYLKKADDILKTVEKEKMTPEQEQYKKISDELKNTKENYKNSFSRNNDLYDLAQKIGK